MTAWTAITATQVAANAPLDTDLGEALRSNQICLRQGILLSVFDEFAGDGSDGARTDSGSGTFATGSGKQLTNWTIDAGVTVTLTDSGTRNCTLIGVSGTLTINGTISLDGQGYAGGAGSSFASTAAAHSYGNYLDQWEWMNTAGGGGGGAASGGTNGSNGGNAYLTPHTYAAGGAGGVANAVGGNASSAGAAGGLAWWRKFLHRAVPGPAGGAGGGAGYDNIGPFDRPGGAGGASGSGLIIECDTLDFDSGGVITSDGAAGSAGTNGTSAGGGGGGGGAGGFIIIIARNIVDNSGTLTVTGGNGAAGGTGTYNGGAGGNGGAGWTLIQELA